MPEAACEDSALGRRHDWLIDGAVMPAMGVAGTSSLELA